jgi:TonB family protein
MTARTTIEFRRRVVRGVACMLLVGASATTVDAQMPIADDATTIPDVYHCASRSISGRYPPRMLRRQISGTVEVTVGYGSDARVHTTSVKRSSGHLELDRAALARGCDAVPIIDIPTSTTELRYGVSTITFTLADP